MQSDLGLEKGYIDELSNRVDSLYRKIKIKGRTIEAPSEELKLVQCWISDFVRASTPSLPEYVTAYETGCSIVKNAQRHLANSHILNLDIKNFFHACKRSMVEKVFSASVLGYAKEESPIKLSENDVKLLGTLSCFRGSLSVGSPCSPALANRIMIQVDEKIISELGGKYSYSRYSDDITLSSDDWISKELVVDCIGEILNESGFELNVKKTKCIGKGNRRSITGIYLTPQGGLSIGSRRKKEIKHLLYDYLVCGQGSANQIVGLIYFATMVEPLWVAKLLSKYAQYGNARTQGVMGCLKA